MRFFWANFGRLKKLENSRNNKYFSMPNFYLFTKAMHIYLLYIKKITIRLFSGQLPTYSGTYKYFFSKIFTFNSRSSVTLTPNSLVIHPPNQTCPVNFGFLVSVMSYWRISPWTLKVINRGITRSVVSTLVSRIAA